METKNIDIIPVEQAIQCRKIKSYETGQMIEPLTACITRVFMLCGQTCGKHDLQLAASELARSIKERFPEVSLQEIAIALDRGVKKDYGEYYGLNIVTMLDWIRAYAKSPQRAKYIAEQEKKQTEPVLTQEEIDSKNRETAIAIFDNYKATGKFKSAIIFCAVAYDYLRSVQVITLTPKTTADAKELAKKQISRLEQDRYSGIHHTNELDYIITQAIKDRLSDKRQMEIATKAFGLKLYFDGLIRQNIDLREIIQQTVKTPP